MKIQEARREEIIHAAWRIAASGGIGAVTVRSIATEIGYTTGSVMHHFSTKEEIVEEMINRLYRGLREHYHAARLKAPPSGRLEGMLLSCLPLNPRLAFGWRLSVALQAEVLRSVTIAKLHRRHYSIFEQDLLVELVALSKDGRIGKDFDLDFICARLIVIIEGIGTNHVLRPRSMPPKLQRRLLLTEFAKLFDNESLLKLSEQ